MDDEELVESAGELFQDHPEELGFVMKPQVKDAHEDGGLYTIVKEVDGEEEVVAAAIVTHCETKPQSTLNDIVVSEDYRRQGHAETLIERALNDSPHEYLQAKCPEDLSANDFYDSTGWEKVDVESGKERALNVWRLIDESSQRVMEWGDGE